MMNDEFKTMNTGGEPEIDNLLVDWFT